MSELPEISCIRTIQYICLISGPDLPNDKNNFAVLDLSATQKATE